MKTVHKAVTKVKNKRITAAAAADDMRMYWLAYNVALESDVVELLEHLNIKAFTAWEEVKGCGRSGPHLNDEVWPAVNALYMLVAPASLEPVLVSEVEKIRAQFPGEGVKLMVQPCLKIY
jgi:hypothetical protein